MKTSRTTYQHIREKSNTSAGETPALVLLNR